jgi:hypothetical protein
MEPEVSVSCSQDTAIRPCSEQDESSRTSLFMSLRSVLILSSHVHPGVTSDFFLSDFPKKVLHAFFTCPVHDTYPVHLFRIDMVVFSKANDVDFPYKLPPPMQLMKVVTLKLGAHTRSHPVAEIHTEQNITKHATMLRYMFCRI